MVRWKNFFRCAQKHYILRERVVSLTNPGAIARFPMAASTKKASSKQKNLSREEQIQIGLEYVALAFEYCIHRRGNKNRRSLGDVIELLEDMRNPAYLHSGHALSEKGEAFDDPVSYEDRKYRMYMKKIQTIVPGFAADFQRGIVQKFKEKKHQKQFCAFYFKELCFAYNDDALELYVRNLADVSQALFQAVAIKYSILHKLRLIFEYTSIDGSIQSRREVIPLAVTARRQYLDLIALEVRRDASERIIKQFALSGVGMIESDLFESFYDPNRGESEIQFDLDEYDANNPAARFGRKKVRFRLLLRDNSFQHFRQSYPLDYKLLRREGDSVEVELHTHDHRLVYSIVFDYGERCQLLEPDFAVGFLKKKFAALAGMYA